MHKIGSRVCQASKGTQNHKCCEFDFFVLSYLVFLTTHYYLKANLIPTNRSKTEQVYKAAIPQKELKNADRYYNSQAFAHAGNS